MSEPSIVDVAKAPIIAYNEKDWNAARSSLASGAVYDEVGTRRKVQGTDAIVATWQGWAAAMPDSKATFHNVVASGSTVLVELTWRGTHTGPLKMPSGDIAPTGKKFEVRGCQVIEVAGGKAKAMRHYFDMRTLLEQLGVTS
jgi:steroid delta-isomerase-like uncharacterized protein